MIPFIPKDLEDWLIVNYEIVNGISVEDWVAKGEINLVSGSYRFCYDSVYKKCLHFSGDTAISKYRLDEIVKEWVDQYFDARDLVYLVEKRMEKFNEV